MGTVVGKHLALVLANSRCSVAGRGLPIFQAQALWWSRDDEVSLAPRGRLRVKSGPPGTADSKSPLQKRKQKPQMGT